jgi:hypothetical protein
MDNQASGAVPPIDNQASGAVHYGFPSRLMTALLFALSGVFAILVFMSASDKGTIAFCSIGSALLAVIWPLVPNITNLKIGLSGVEIINKLDEANTKAANAESKANDALAKFTRFVFNSMPRPTFDNLKKIADGHFGSYKMSDGFRQELRYLRDSGYILTKDIAIGNIPINAHDLSDFVYITDLGKDFIKQREAAEAAAPPPLVQKV